MKQPVAELNTERLRLRQWWPADRAPFAAMNADLEVMQFFPETMNEAQSQAMADHCEALIAERGWGFWALEQREQKRFLGFVGLNIPNVMLPFQPCVEIGWRLRRDAWGNGYATEAAAAVLEFGFDNLELEEIVAFTSVLNYRSQAVMERLGMARQEDTFDHPSVPEGMPIREHCLYRLSAGDWRRR